MEAGSSRRAAWRQTILRVLILLLGAYGQYRAFAGAGFMQRTPLMYFTNLSNWFILLVTLLLLVYAVRSLLAGGRTPQLPRIVYAVWFTAVTSITLTFLVFGVLLTPRLIADGAASYLITPENLCVHNLVPLLAIADWSLHAWPWKPKRRAVLLGTVGPLLYTAYVAVCNVAGIRFGKGDIVPYFFFDYAENGWFTLAGGRLGVVWWFLLLTIAVLLMSAGLMALKNARARHMALRENA